VVHLQTVSAFSNALLHYDLFDYLLYPSQMIQKPAK